jgi:hypothetical protein
MLPDDDLIVVIFVLKIVISQIFILEHLARLKIGNGALELYRVLG